MQNKKSEDRFIPLRKTDVIQACIDLGNLPSNKEQEFSTLCHLIISTLHFEYHQNLEVLKDNYAPFDPNSDTQPLKVFSDEELRVKQGLFANAFTQVLNAANFEKITEQDLRDALSEESLFKVRLAVEFNDFSEMVFYRRGEYQKTETIIRFWGLKKESITFTNYDKVAVYIKFKDKGYFSQQKKSTSNFEPGSTIIKLFQNVPKADLEMLFPNSEVRMRTIDKIIIGGSAVAGGTVVLVTKLGASIVVLVGILSFWLGLSDKSVTITSQQLIILGTGVGVLGGFIFKEWSKFKNRKLRFLKALSDNLYFKNLDNNAGVFHNLIDAAEEEESKEAILAYYFLMSQGPMSSEQLDNKIEDWLAHKFNLKIDFEISDALSKLHRFGIIIEEGQNYRALPMIEAQKQLDSRWDNIFNCSG